MNNIAQTILNKNIKNLNTNNTKILPIYSNVVLEFYDDNPYRMLETTESGVLLGIDSTKKYKSNETGEMEEAVDFIACAKVIAVGPDCKYIKEGEDVFAVKGIANKLPYRNQPYYVINESNIICRIENA